MSNEKSDEEKKSFACPECGSADIINDETRGEQICTNCGAVIDDHFIDEGPEWRAFTSEERNKRSRVGSPTSFAVHDKGLATQIGWENRDVYGKK
ncbi:MAG: TFIIB-type zinc ribbon-containing protein, partial [Asgard group archaeon]|nr:TFIIB-type zinc ribbon-containing protein [Asgard group archaeon]